MVVGGVARVSGGKVLMAVLGMGNQMAFVSRGVFCAVRVAGRVCGMCGCSGGRGLMGF
jgi:hypothetical protein